jgi:hypothetical protein
MKMCDGRCGHSLFYVLEGKETNKSFKDIMSLNGIDHHQDLLSDTSDLVGCLNLFEEDKIYFFKDFERSNPRFEEQSCEKLQKNTFGEGMV